MNFKKSECGDNLVIIKINIMILCCYSPVCKSLSANFFCTSQKRTKWNFAFFKKIIIILHNTLLPNIRAVFFLHYELFCCCFLYKQSDCIDLWNTFVSELIYLQLEYYLFVDFNKWNFHSRWFRICKCLILVC